MEQAYPQVQREALAIAWSVKKLYFYLFGHEFTIMCDNQALKFIFGDNRLIGKRACNRADAFALNLQSFNYKIIHLPGKQNIADILSRLTTLNADTECIGYIMDEKYFAITPHEIRKATEQDEQLQMIMSVLMKKQVKDWPLDLTCFKTFKEELYEWNGILWRGDRIVLPKTLKENALEIAHRGHPGVVTMKRMLRERVWWPNLDNDVKQFTESCLGCTCVARTDPPEPLTMTVLPNEAWEFIAIDFFEAPEVNATLLVIVDYFSRYVAIKKMIAKTAKAVIEKLEDLFHLLDYPRILRCDNGPPFASTEFNDYCKKVGIKLDHSIPLWAQSNGEVERQNQGIKKALRIAKLEKKNWKEAVEVEVDAYNKRPHSVTGIAPLELLINRRVRSFLPERKQESNRVDDYEGVREKDQVGKAKMKEYADKRRKAKESDLKIGDTVLLKNIKIGKLQPNYDPDPFKVVDTVGKKAIIQNSTGSKLERSKTELKRFKGSAIVNEAEEESQSKEERVKRVVKKPTKFEDYQMKEDE